jgi:tol-pal system protein YbgF
MAMIRILSLGLAFSATGCFAFVTKEDGDVMNKKIAALEAKNKQLETTLAELSGNTSAMQSKMQKAVDEATKVLTRNNADVGLTVQKTQADLAALTGRVDDVDTREAAHYKSLSDSRAAMDTKVEQLVNNTTTAKAPPIPDTADAVFADAKKRLEAKQWNDARRVFDAFINRYPTDPRAGQAQYMIGDSYMKEQKFANAINAFLKVIEGFPKAEVVPDAMFEAGDAFYQLKYCGDARVYFQELLKRYPKTEWKKDATQKLKDLQRDGKNKSVCQS